jgi:hypothetical protein
MGHDHRVNAVRIDRTVFVVILLVACGTAAAVTEALRSPAPPPLSRAEALLDLLARDVHSAPTRVEIAPDGETVLVLLTDATWRYRKSPAGWIRDQTGPVAEAALADGGVVALLDTNRASGGLSVWRLGVRPSRLADPGSSGRVEGLAVARDASTVAAWVVEAGGARLVRWSVDGPVADSGLGLEREENLPEVVAGPGAQVAFADFGRIALARPDGREFTDGDAPVWFWPDGRVGLARGGTVFGWDGELLTAEGPGGRGVGNRIPAIGRGGLALGDCEHGPVGGDGPVASGAAALPGAGLVRERAVRPLRSGRR